MHLSILLELNLTGNPSSMMTPRNDTPRQLTEYDNAVTQKVVFPGGWGRCEVQDFSKISQFCNLVPLGIFWFKHKLFGEICSFPGCFKPLESMGLTVPPTLPLVY